MVASIPRGVRNCNPGNIRHSQNAWQGEASSQTDASFVTFKTMAYGVRAAAKLFLNYQERVHLDTVRKLIQRWAPPVENNTDAYVNSVAASCHVDPNAEYDLELPGKLFALVKAVIAHENGVVPHDWPSFPQWVSDNDIRAGVGMAME